MADEFDDLTGGGMFGVDESPGASSWMDFLPSASTLADTAKLAGSALQAYGLYSQGQNVADAARKNAAGFQLTARDVLNQGVARTYQVDRAGRLAQGRALAGYGGAGVQMDGSPMAVMLMGEQNIALDKLNIMHTAQRQAAALEKQAANALQSGQNAQTGANLTSAASLLSSIPSALSLGSKVAGLFGGATDATAGATALGGSGAGMSTYLGAGAAEATGVSAASLLAPEGMALGGGMSGFGAAGAGTTSSLSVTGSLPTQVLGLEAGAGAAGTAATAAGVAEGIGSFSLLGPAGLAMLGVAATFGLFDDDGPDKTLPMELTQGTGMSIYDMAIKDPERLESLIKGASPQQKAQLVDWYGGSTSDPRELRIALASEWAEQQGRLTAYQNELAIQDQWFKDNAHTLNG